MGKPTNIYYYGARYYNPRWSSLSASGGWLSVDPLADKYPHASPYNYCLNNPVIFVDPDGRKVDNFVIGSDNSVTFEDDGSDLISVNGIPIEDFNFSGNENALREITKHYFNDAGIEGDNNVYFNFFEDGDFIKSELSGITLEYTFGAISKSQNNGESGVITSLNSGKIIDKETFRNKNNLINALSHEKVHLDQNLKNGQYSSYHEVEAYKHMINHKSWNATTSNHKSQIMHSFKKEITKLSLHYDKTRDGRVYIENARKLLR